MNSSDVFYLCPTCFAVLTQNEDNHVGRMINEDNHAGRMINEDNHAGRMINEHSHAHRMIAVPIRNLPLDQRRPLSDAQGRLLTQAPRWFVTLTFPMHAGRAG